MVLLKELLLPCLHFLLFLHLLPEAHLHFMGKLTCTAKVVVGGKYLILASTESVLAFSLV